VTYVALADQIADFQAQAVSSKRLKQVTEWRFVIFQKGTVLSCFYFLVCAWVRNKAFKWNTHPVLQIQKIRYLLTDQVRLGTADVNTFCFSFIWQGSVGGLRLAGRDWGTEMCRRDYVININLDSYWPNTIICFYLQ
jgi:hypothetical protein